MTRHRHLTRLLAAARRPAAARRLLGRRRRRRCRPSRPRPRRRRPPPRRADPIARPTYPPGCPTAQPAPLGAGETRTVTITTDKGDIVIEDRGAPCRPIAAGNFVALAECGYYDGVVFHRLVPGFVIQGGDGQFGRVPERRPGRSSAPAARRTRSRTSR